MSNDGFSNFLGRDNILVNTDLEGYHGYLRGREERSKQKEKLDQINNINNDIIDLKNKFNRLEELLLQVLDKK